MRKFWNMRPVLVKNLWSCGLGNCMNRMYSPEYRTLAQLLLSVVVITIITSRLPCLISSYSPWSWLPCYSSIFHRSLRTGLKTSGPSFEIVQEREHMLIAAGWRLRRAMGFMAPYVPAEPEMLQQLEKLGRLHDGHLCHFSKCISNPSWAFRLLGLLGF